MSCLCQGFCFPNAAPCPSSSRSTTSVKTLYCMSLRKQQAGCWWNSGGPLSSGRVLWISKHINHCSFMEPAIGLKAKYILSWSGQLFGTWNSICDLAWYWNTNKLSRKQSWSFYLGEAKTSLLLLRKVYDMEAKPWRERVRAREGSQLMKWCMWCRGSILGVNHLFEKKLNWSCDDKVKRVQLGGEELRDWKLF